MKYYLNELKGFNQVDIHDVDPLFEDENGYYTTKDNFEWWQELFDLEDEFERVATPDDKNEQKSIDDWAALKTFFGKILEKRRQYWEINGYQIYEVDHDCDLHAFKVLKDDKVLGLIIPSSIDDMADCKKELNAGHDPVTYGWEDGLGNTCTDAGW